MMTHEYCDDNYFAVTRLQHRVIHTSWLSLLFSILSKVPFINPIKKCHHNFGILVLVTESRTRISGKDVAE